MKKYLLSILFFKISVFAQVVTIPDINFLNKLLAASSTVNIARSGNLQVKIDTNGDGFIQVSEASVITYLRLTAANITSIVGIQSFSNLTSLGVSTNQIASVNASNLNQLIDFNCTGNQISSLILNPTSLQNLYLGTNSISNFNFAACPNLKRVLCDNNNFSTLNFGSNPLLTEMTCSNNPNLTYVNVKNGATQLVGAATPWPDCWTTNNFNITSICADSNEIAALQTYLATCPFPVPPINSNCALGNERFVANTLKVYPNPSNSIFNINLVSNYQMLEVHDLLGKVVFSKNIYDLSKITIDLSGSAPGVYVARLSGEDGGASLKLLKN